MISHACTRRVTGLTHTVTWASSCCLQGRVTVSVPFFLEIIFVSRIASRCVARLGIRAQDRQFSSLSASAPGQGCMIHDTKYNNNMYHAGRVIYSLLRRNFPALPRDVAPSAVVSCDGGRRTFGDWCVAIPFPDQPKLPYRHAP